MMFSGDFDLRDKVYSQCNVSKKCELNLQTR